MIVLFDAVGWLRFRRFQKAQYGDGAEFATSDTVAVNYLQLASAVSGIHAGIRGSTIESLSKSRYYQPMPIPGSPWSMCRSTMAMTRSEG